MCLNLYKILLKFQGRVTKGIMSSSCTRFLHKRKNELEEKERDKEERIEIEKD